MSTPENKNRRFAIRLGQLLDTITYGLIRILKDRFSLLGVGFIIYIVFIDDYNVIYRFTTWQEVLDKRQKKAYIEDQIQQVSSDLKDLFSTRPGLEKFAREKYFMKRSDEDIFVLEVQ